MAITIKELVESRVGSTVGYGVGNQDTTRTFKMTFTGSTALADATSTDPYPVMMGTSTPVIAGSIPIGSSHPWPTVTAQAQKYQVVGWRPGLPGYIMKVMYEPLSSLLEQGWTWTVQGQTETERVYETVVRPLPGGTFTVSKLIGSVRYRPWRQGTVGLNDPAPAKYFIKSKHGIESPLMPEGDHSDGLFNEKSFRNFEGCDVPTGGGSMLIFKRNAGITSVGPTIIGLLESLRGTCNQGSFASFTNEPGTILFYDFEVALQDGVVTSTPFPQQGQPLTITLRFLYRGQKHTPIRRPHLWKPDDGEEGPIYRLNPESPGGIEYVRELFDVIPLTDLNSIFGMIGP